MNSDVQETADKVLEYMQAQPEYRQAQQRVAQLMARSFTHGTPPPTDEDIAAIVADCCEEFLRR